MTLKCQERYFETLLTAQCRAVCQLNWRAARAFQQRLPYGVIPPAEALPSLACSPWLAAKDRLCEALSITAHSSTMLSPDFLAPYLYQDIPDIPCSIFSRIFKRM